MSLGTTADPEARGWALDACYGPSKSSKWPDSVLLALFHGDPTTGGTELAATGGYIAVVIDNTSIDNFPDAVGPDWEKLLGVSVLFAPSTGAFSDDADYWAFLSPDGHILDSGPINDPVTGAPLAISVTAADTIVRFLAGQLSILTS